MGESVLPLKGCNEHQWSQISRIAALLQQDYTDRILMLRKRLDVTVQSFKWADKAKPHLETINGIYKPIHELLSGFTAPGVVDLLAARDNVLFTIEKTSGRKARAYTASKLNKTLIGRVPDRGGRANELEPPPPEMPQFRARQPDNRGGGGGGGRGGGFRGGQRGGGGGGRGRGGGRGYSDGGGGQQRGRGASVYGGVGGSFSYSGGDIPQSHPYVAPSAQLINPYDQMSALNQQMGGLVFEAGMGYQPQQGHIVYQPVVGSGNAPQRPFRGGRGGGRSHRGGGGRSGW